MGQKSGTLPNFYPRPPRGGRLEAEQCEEASDCISIHALREEGDPLTNRPKSTHI